jgi:ADP-heptose:LPS heptosyltransferase
MVDALKDRYPDSRIDMLVNQRVYELVCDYPNINKVHSIEKVTTGAVFAISSSGKYDLAIIVYPVFGAAYGIFKAGIKYRLGTAYRWYSFLFNIRHHQHRKDSIKHESIYNLDLLRELNVFIDKKIVPKLNVTEESLQSAKDKLNRIGIDPEKPYVVIHIPSLGSARVWSDNSFLELLKLIAGDVNNCYQVLLTGTESDSTQVKGILEKLPENSVIYSIFNLNLKELAAVIKGSALFLGNSTGPIHIAAAVGTFVVGLYSPVKTESVTRWGPLTERKKIFTPLIDNGSVDVMDEIHPVDVFEFINNFMKKAIKNEKF